MKTKTQKAFVPLVLLMTVGIACAGLLGYIVLNAQKNTSIYQDVARTQPPASDLRQVSAETDASYDQYDGIRAIEAYDDAEYGFDLDMSEDPSVQEVFDPSENSLDVDYTQP